MFSRGRAGLAAALLLAAPAFAAGDSHPPGGPAPKLSPQEFEAETADCMSCHEDPELEVDLESEEVKSMSVDAAVLAGSVHARLACTECHTDLRGKTSGHKGKGLPNLRAYSGYFSEQCKQCHFDNYTKSLDGVHHRVNAKEDSKLEAALCTDCHGGHDVSAASSPRSKISRTCATCHEKEVQVYAKSVHGKSLAAEENPDVPTCTDCHRAHDIADPKAGAWQLTTPQMCGSCHTDEKMMARYGLSTNVLSTYLADFHGQTTLLQKSEGDVKPAAALCTDCHGVHDIRSAKDPESSTVRANLVVTCQKCHPDATENFPASWMSHYEPTFESATLVWAVKAGYQFLIPFMIGGLVLQILLHLWRVVVNR
jgi:predicted CXXCH cytochrome family protein